MLVIVKKKHLKPKWGDVDREKPDSLHAEENEVHCVMDMAESPLQDCTCLYLYDMPAHTQPHTFKEKKNFFFIVPLSSKLISECFL